MPGTGIVWRKCRACGRTGHRPPEILSDELTQQFREMFATAKAGG